MKKILIFAIAIYIAAGDSLYYIKDKKIVPLKPYDATKQMRGLNRNDEKLRKNVSYYQNDSGILLGVTNKLIVKLKSNNIDRYLNEYNLTMVKKLGNKIYLLQVSDKNKTIVTSTYLSKEKGVIYAHPDFIKKQIHR